MSQLTDIYNSLINDPDIIPPKKMSKNKFVLNMAQQRIQQHENNAAALEMGFVKTNGHFSNGNSAVNKLAAFVKSPEASPDTDVDLLLEKQRRRDTWWNKGEFNLDIDISVVENLERKGHSREEIAKIVTAFTDKNKGVTYPMSEANKQTSFSDAQIAERIKAKKYSFDEIQTAGGRIAFQRDRIQDEQPVQQETPGPDTGIDEDEYDISYDAEGNRVLTPKKPKGGEEKPKDAKHWHDREELKISTEAVEDLEGKGYSRDSIRSIVADHQERDDSEKVLTDTGSYAPLSDEEVQNAIDQGDYEEDIKDRKHAVSPHPLLQVEFDAAEEDEGEEVKSQSQKKAEARQARLDKIKNRTGLIESVANSIIPSFAGKGDSELHELEDHDVNMAISRIRATSDKDFKGAMSDLTSARKALGWIGNNMEAIQKIVAKPKEELFPPPGGKHKITNPKIKERLMRHFHSKGEAKSSREFTRRLEAGEFRFLRSTDNLNAYIENNPWGQETGGGPTGDETGGPDSLELLLPKAAAALKRHFTEEGFNNIMENYGDKNKQLFDAMGQPRRKTDAEGKLITGDAKRWIGYDPETGKQTEYKKQSDAPLGRFVTSLSDVRDYIKNLEDPEHPHNKTGPIQEDGEGEPQPTPKPTEGEEPPKFTRQARDAFLEHFNGEEDALNEAIKNGEFNLPEGKTKWTLAEAKNHIKTLDKPLPSGEETNLGEYRSKSALADDLVERGIAANIGVAQRMAGLIGMGKINIEDALAYEGKGDPLTFSTDPSAVQDLIDHIKEARKAPIDKDTSRPNALLEKIRQLGIDPDSEEGLKIQTNRQLAAALKEINQTKNEDEINQNIRDGEEPKSQIIPSSNQDPSSEEVYEATKDILKNPTAIRMARKHGMVDKDGNLTNLGHAFFEVAAPLVSESVKEFEARIDDVNTVLKKPLEDGGFGYTQGMRIRNPEGHLSATLFQQLIQHMRRAGVDFHADYDPDTLEEGAVLNDPTRNPNHNEEPAEGFGSILTRPMIDSAMIISRLSSEQRPVGSIPDFMNSVRIVAANRRFQLINQGMDPTNADNLIDESIDDTINTTLEENLNTDGFNDFLDIVDHNLQTNHPDIAATPVDWNKQPPMFEDMGFKPYTPSGELTTAADETVDEHVASRQEQIEQGQKELFGFKPEDRTDWGTSPAQQNAEKARRAKLTLRERQVEDLKKVMHGDAHDDLTSDDAYSDKEIKDMWNKQVRDPRARTKAQAKAAEAKAAEASEDKVAKPKAEAKRPNRAGALARLARLQNPDLIGEDDEVLDQDAMDRAIAKLDNHYTEDVFELKDIIDAVKAQSNLVANQAAQQSQERKNRLSGADKVRAVSDFEEQFPTPEQWTEQNEGQQMSPEVAKDLARELINFQYRQENFDHFGIKTGDKDDVKALQERLRSYGDLNPNAMKEIAAEMLSAERAGIDIGTDEFLDHVKEFQEAAAREGRKASADEAHKLAKIAHALENGNFSRGYDKDGNEVQHGLDHMGSLEHTSADIEHEDGQAPLVHATDEDGYADTEVQPLANELHEAKLASSRVDKEWHKDRNDIINKGHAELREDLQNAKAATAKNNKAKDDGHAQAEADYEASNADIDQRQRRDTSERQRRTTDEHKKWKDAYTSVRDGKISKHDTDLAEVDKFSNLQQSLYDEARTDITNAKEAHQNVVDVASAKRIETTHKAEQAAEAKTDKVTKKHNKEYKDLLEQQGDERESHNQRARDMLTETDASLGVLNQEHANQLTELQSTNSQALEALQAKQNEEWQNAEVELRDFPEALSTLQKTHTNNIDELEKSIQQQELALQQTQTDEINEHADKLKVRENELIQAMTDLNLRQADERQAATESLYDADVQINATLEDAIEQAREQESITVARSEKYRNQRVQATMLSAKLETSIKNDEDIAGAEELLQHTQSTAATNAAARREQITDTYLDAIRDGDKEFLEKIRTVFSDAEKEADVAAESFTEERGEAVMKLRRGRLAANRKHTETAKAIKDGQEASMQEISENTNKALKELDAARPPKNQEAADRVAAAEAALDEKFKDDPEKAAAIKSGRHMGESKEAKKASHEEDGSGPSGKTDPDGEPKKPVKTRMVPVKDSAGNPTGEMKKQYWVAGRGLGWLDEDTYMQHMGKGGSGERAAKENIVVVQPQKGNVGDDDYQAAYGVHGSRIFPIETADHPNASIHDDALDHHGVIGRALGNMPEIMNHPNMTSGGESYDATISPELMDKLRESAGGKPRDPKKPKGKWADRLTMGGQFFGEAAQQRAAGGEFAAYGRAAQAFGRMIGVEFKGSSDYVNNLQRKKSGGQQGSRGQQRSRGQNIANMLRSARQRGRKAIGGAYIKGNLPVNVAEADPQVEAWRRITGIARAFYRKYDPKHAKELDYMMHVEDRRERKSSRDQHKKWQADIRAKMDARPALKKHLLKSGEQQKSAVQQLSERMNVI